MGLEQSSMHGDSVAGLRRGKSVPNYDYKSGEGSRTPRMDAISPEPSVCSDSELPYISYTKNGPIGESPKKRPGRLSRGKTMESTLPSPLARKFKRKSLQPTGYSNSILVVKEGNPLPNKNNDEDLLKLQNIPMFLPIMRGSLNTLGVRDPEVLERLDSTSLYDLCCHYQEFLKEGATDVASAQYKINQRISRANKDVTQILTVMVNNQRAYAKAAEKYNKIREISNQIEKCHDMLKETLQSMRSLNEMLPDDDKLPPFSL